MQTTIRSLGAVILGGGLFISGCAKKQMASFQSLKNPELAAQLKSFVAEKEAQAKGATNKMPSEFQAFFAVAAKGDWLAVSNAFIELRKHAGPYEHSGKSDERWRGTAWQAVVETWGALEAFGEGDEKYSMVFGTNIIASIPAGSIYFGGTDAGRFIVTAQDRRVRQRDFWKTGFQRFHGRSAFHSKRLLPQDVFQAEEFARRALRLAHATRYRRHRKGAHGA